MTKYIRAYYCITNKEKNMEDSFVNLVKISTIYNSDENESSINGKHASPTKIPTLQDSFNRDKLVLNDISYSVDENSGLSPKNCKHNRKKCILKNINMVLNKGEIVALLGSSGSGKTSLLNVIAHKYNGTVSGEVKLGGRKLTPELFRKKCSYVLQSDSLTNMPHLTTLEILHFIAVLKFRKYNMSKVEIFQKVENVMKEMKIWHVRDVIVGGTIVRGISGGEKRRTCIAAQLLQNPEILLLDEPTTGLDSFTANEIVKSLADLAHNQNKVVFLTIHQPRSDIFKLLDKVGVMCAAELLFFGNRNELVPYFSNIGFSCPPYSNPLDYVVDLCSIDRRSAEIQEKTENRINHIKQEYANSQLHNNIINSSKQQTITSNSFNLINKKQKQLQSSSNVKEQHYKCSYLRLECSALPILIRRMFLNISKDRASVVIRGLTMTLYAFFIWLYLPYLGKDFRSLQDRTGILYQTVAIPPNVGILNAVALFPALRDQFLQESSDGLYGCLSFLTAYYIHILPFHIVSSFLFSVWAYVAVGLHPGMDRFFTYFSVILLGQYNGEALTVLLLGITKASLGQSFGVILISISILLSSGLIGATSSLMVPLQWLSYVSFIKYTSEIAVVNEYDGLKFECEANGTTIPCPGIDGNDYLDYMFPGAIENQGRNYGLLFAFIFMFWVLSLLLFQWKKQRYYRN